MILRNLKVVFPTSKNIFSFQLFAFRNRISFSRILAEFRIVGLVVQPARRRVVPQVHRALLDVVVVGGQSKFDDSDRRELVVVAEPDGRHRIGIDDSESLSAAVPVRIFLVRIQQLSVHFSIRGSGFRFRPGVLNNKTSFFITDEGAK